MPEESREVIQHEDDERRVHYESYTERLLWKRKYPYEHHHAAKDIVQLSFSTMILKSGSSYLFREECPNEEVDGRVKCSVDLAKTQPLEPFVKCDLQQKTGHRIRFDRQLIRDKQKTKHAGIDRTQFDAAVDASPLDAVIQAELQEQCSKCRANLPADEQQAICLYTEEDLSTREAAEVMGLALKEYSQLLHRALKNLRTCMWPYFERGEDVEPENTDLKKTEILND